MPSKSQGRRAYRVAFRKKVYRSIEVDGMPHLESIFLHSESVDGSNAGRVRALSVSSDLKIASKQLKIASKQ